MSATSESTSDDSSLETEYSSAFVHPTESFNYAVTHIFFPVCLPEQSDYTLKKDASLVRAVCATAHAYTSYVRGTPEEDQWHRITKMLDNLLASAQLECLNKGHIISQLLQMQTGDIITLFIRRQNAAVMLTKEQSCMLCESFEVSPRQTAGSLICSYPSSAVEIPNEVFDNENFQSEFVNFLIGFGPPKSRFGHPLRITALLTGIMQVVGRAVTVPLITKRVRDETRSYWRRSFLWLLIRITIQMSVHRSPPGRTFCKNFMLFFLCTLAQDGQNANASNDLLHLMSSKILRRLTKLGSSAPDWLSEMALKTCNVLREILDSRWKQPSARQFSFRNPSQDDLERDTQVLLVNSGEYIRNTLTNSDSSPPTILFQPNHHRRGTLEDFLSSDGSFFDEAYNVDPEVTINDVEQLVEQGIDDWVAHVTDIDGACAQLEILMDEYMFHSGSCHVGPEGFSIRLLTGIELYIAMDKLVVREVPMLADYPPEIPIPLLEGMVLRKATSLHRLACAYQYLSARHSQSRPGWSVLSNEFTEDSFPVRYYDQSPHLHQLKARIEQDAMGRVTGRTGPGHEVRVGGSVRDEYEKHLPGRQLSEGTGGFQLPLPTWLLDAKAVVFELQCPLHIRAWRFAALPILDCLGNIPRWIIEWNTEFRESDCRPLGHVPALQPYLVKRQGPRHLKFHVYYGYLPHESRNHPTLRYLIQNSNRGKIIGHYDHSKSRSRHNTLSVHPKYLPRYVLSTSHTSNDVLSGQVGCPVELSLDEFISSAHLRSGSSLQWLNILRGLCTKTLNLRRPEVHTLVCAAFQVGSLDLNTGTWVWHQELQDPTFCNTLLDELDSLFLDSRSIDGVSMSTISLLLTRLLASSPSEDVSERAIMLLRSVRRKTFGWMQDLSYDLTMAPMNEKRGKSLLNMVAACQSTFDVDPAIFRKILHSAEDVDTLLSCALFMHALDSKHTVDILLFQQGERLLPAFEEVLRDVILADPSDYGVDLAIGKIFTSYHPGADRWKSLQSPNARWITSETKAFGDQPSQAVHVDLFDGSLRIGGRQSGNLPREIRASKEFKRIFSDAWPSVIGFFVTPSDLPGMDFMTLHATPKYKVHLSLRDDGLALRAECNRTGEVLALIPSTKLLNDLPPALVDGHVHWLNLKTKIIEIRPLKQLWEESSENWRIDCTSEKYRVFKGHETFVDMQSPTWEIVSGCFDCFGIRSDDESDDESSNKSGDSDILITTSPIDTDHSGTILQLSVILPRYGLSFFVNETEELESHEFKDMVYDENQCVGTLLGLENLFVLRPKTHVAGTLLPEALIPRRAIAPYGFPKKHAEHQVRIHFDMPGFPPTSGGASYRTYNVDTELGCLIGDDSLMSTRFLAYLHATTGCYHPDPLTGKTGIEAALCLLQSAGCQSIMEFKHLPRNFQLDDRTGEPEEEPWSSTEHYEINIVHDKIQNRYYWQYNSYYDSNETAKWRARRAAQLLPSNAIVMEDCDMEDCDMVYSIPESDLEMQDVVSTVLSAIRHSPTNVLTANVIPTWAKLCSDQNTRSRPSPWPYYDPEIPSNVDLTQTLITKGRNMLEKSLREGPQERFQLLFSLPVLVYRLPQPRAAFLSILHALATSHLGKPLLPSDVLDRYDRTTGKQALQTHVHSNRSSELVDGTCCELSGYTLNQNIPFRITLDQLLSNRPPPELPSRSTLPRNAHRDRSNKTSVPIPPLNQLFSSLQTNSVFQRDYLALLERSEGARKECHMTHGSVAKDWIESLQKHYEQSRVNYMNALGILKRHLGPETDREQLLERLGQWPLTTADVLLRCLASTPATKLSAPWKKCLILFALLLLELQRSRRLLRHALDGHEEEFLKELENEQCDGWDPEEYPDWLLIQIQGNFLIRRAQAETAMELMYPQSRQNTVMQINMGEGKSSVIIPIAAAALADGTQLVRIIVPKMLTAQMFDLLVARLGGLPNRPIYHLPFSRSSSDYLDVDLVQEIMSQCMHEHGILLMQPEHVVSLKLMSVEEQTHQRKLSAYPFPKSRKTIYEHVMKCLSLGLLPEDSLVGNIFQWLSQPPNHPRTKDVTQADHRDSHSGDAHSALDNASEWVRLQEWLRSHVRDILDESDDILHSRFQLIYTIGLEQHMEGYPDRWTVTQQVLRLVKHHAHTIARNHPESVEYECGVRGSFPHVRIVQTSNVGPRLITMIVEDVMAGRLCNFSFHNIPPGLHGSIRSFISDKDILQIPEIAKAVEEYGKDSGQSHLWNGLLLLRGLLASNVLLFALAERRWRVDYGLVPLPEDGEYFSVPTKLAVPYRAKDVPAPDTQFGHPDLTIILTCLSYYYTGLTEKQLRYTFEILLAQDDPFTEYSTWIEDHDRESLPDSLRDLKEINLRSSEQWDRTVFPLFSRNQAVIDFYLARVVFPKEAKEFPWKLSASSWDLAEKRERLTTGFSGTNDGRWLLPLSVTQHDLDHQRGTNASVLAYLLQPENNSYTVTHENGKRRTTYELLQLVAVQRPEVRVLLDVGAQVLDLSNLQVAEAWLDITRAAAGAIYFNEDDELMALPRNSVPELLSLSPLSERLDLCVVYLDHAHTRGTDLKFPVGSRAAVTLGPKVTKDSLVQGCMRMRKLGRDHSVMFFAPPGVDQSIRTVTGKNDPNTQVTTVDILCWAIHETWIDIQQRAPYWAQQGINHKTRHEAWTRFCNDELTPEQLSDAWLQSEAKSLEDLYAPCAAESAKKDLLTDPAIRQRCKDVGVLSLPDARMDEEQEREVHREREREREVELPPRAVPAEHYLHPDVVAFVKTGVIPQRNSESAFLPVFKTLEKSSAATREADTWSPHILATADFSKTVEPESTQGTIDQYLRPVQWILSSKKDQALVLLSPFEAHHLMPDIRASEHVHLHLYAPRTSKRMKPCDDLRLYSIPPLPSDWTPPWDLIDQLNIFAGQLYLRDYESYLRVCRFLGVPTKESPKDGEIRRNLFNIPGSFEEVEMMFSSPQLPFVMALLAIRTRGRPFAHTHMGKILQGQVLTKKDFERRPSPPPLSQVPIQKKAANTGQAPHSTSTGKQSMKRRNESQSGADDSTAPPSKRFKNVVGGHSISR